jgi:hypothetical protein
MSYDDCIRIQVSIFTPNALGSTFKEENETIENAWNAAVSVIRAVVTMNIAPAICGHAHL